MRSIPAILLALVPALAAGQDPVDNEFQVNAYTTSDQDNSAVASDSDGNFVVVWSSRGSSGNDAYPSRSIQARRFAADGTPLEATDFQVNTYTTGDQAWPAVASDSDGNFVVVWQSDGSFGNDSISLSIQLRRFGADGTPLDPAEIQVNTETASLEWRPSIVSDQGGNFIVVWEGADGSHYGIRARRFAADGTPLDAADFQVNTYTADSQVLPAVASDADGNFVVVWDSYGSDGGDTSFRSIQARRFAADGTPIDTAEFQVNTYTTDFQGFPRLASDGVGNFVVAWNSVGSDGTDNDLLSIQARRFAADGTPLDVSEFQVNTYTDSYQRRPAVSLRPEGSFVVVWESYGSHGDDSSLWSVQLRRFAADGAPVDPADFQVNTFTEGLQYIPSMALGRGSDFVLAWNSTGGFGDDTSGASIQARLFAQLLFVDGFESGDTSAWSSTVP